MTEQFRFSDDEREKVRAAVKVSIAVIADAFGVNDLANSTDWVTDADFKVVEDAINRHLAGDPVGTIRRCPGHWSSDGRSLRGPAGDYGILTGRGWVVVQSDGHTSIAQPNSLFMEQRATWPVVYRPEADA